MYGETTGQSKINNCNGWTDMEARFTKATMVSMPHPYPAIDNLSQCNTTYCVA